MSRSVRVASGLDRCAGAQCSGRSQRRRDLRTRQSFYSARRDEERRSAILSLGSIGQSRARHNGIPEESRFLRSERGHRVRAAASERQTVVSTFDIRRTAHPTSCSRHKFWRYRTGRFRRSARFSTRGNRNGKPIGVADIDLCAIRAARVRRRCQRSLRSDARPSFISESTISVRHARHRDDRAGRINARENPGDDLGRERTVAREGRLFDVFSGNEAEPISAREKSRWHIR